MREKWKKYVEKFKSLGDKVSGVKGITAVIPAVCLAVLMVTVLTGYKTPQAKKYEASETEDISQIKEALAKESTAAMTETTKKNTTKKDTRPAMVLCCMPKLICVRKNMNAICTKILRIGKIIMMKRS